jgi:hypothetical protein
MKNPAPGGRVLDSSRSGEFDKTEFTRSPHDPQASCRVTRFAPKARAQLHALADADDLLIDDDDICTPAEMAHSRRRP